MARNLAFIYLFIFYGGLVWQVVETATSGPCILAGTNLANLPPSWNLGPHKKIKRET